jgi:leucyl aminopeptidase (aminopeptidase T)
VTSAPAKATIRKDEKLPEAIESGFASADVVLLLVDTIQNQIFGHHPTKNRATSRGARIDFITTDVKDFTPEKVARIAHVSKSFGDLLSNANRAHLSSELGTDLEMDLTGRESVYFTNYLKNPGEWGAIPDYAEAAIAPIEGSSNGTLVVDGTIVGVGRLVEPARVDIADGKIIAFDESRAARAFKDLLEQGEGDIYAVAELGLGVNEFVHTFTGEFDDKKILGSAHVGIGDNRSLHGDLIATVHIDLIMERVSLSLDGTPLLEKGRLVREI